MHSKNSPQLIFAAVFGLPFQRPQVRVLGHTHTKRKGLESSV